MLVTLLAVAPERRSPAPTPPASPVCPAGTEAMTRIELIFGLARKGRPDVSEEDWRTFLAETVTPRFPGGLTALDGDGQWRNASGVIIREASKVLLIYARPNAAVDAALDEIRSRWRQSHDQESVLLAVAASCVGF